MFQISESDLETLEASCPHLCELIPPDAHNQKTTQDHISMVKSVLSNVRWRDMPWTNVERIDA